MYTAMQKAVNLVNQFVLFFSNLYQFLAQKASYADYRRFARVMHLYAFFANCSEAKSTFFANSYAFCMSVCIV